MKKLTQLEKFGLIAAIVVCGSYFYMKKIYDPEAESLKKTVAKLNQTIGEYNKLEDPPPLEPLRKRLQGESEKLEEATRQLRQAGGRTDADAEVTAILATVTTLAHQRNMGVVKITPGQDHKDDLFTWKSFEVVLHGSYGNLIALIETLRRIEQPVQFKNLQVKPQQGGPGPLLVTATILI